MKIEYDIPTKTTYDAERKVFVIEGQAIDDTVNDQNWQVEHEDLPEFIQQLPQMIIQHEFTADSVTGKIVDAKINPDGRSVWFRAELGGRPDIIEKIQNGWLDMTSAGVSGQCICSACREPSRDANNKLIHLHAGAHEIVKHPRWVEHSIVAKGAYARNKFKPIGFKAAMAAGQLSALQGRMCNCRTDTKCANSSACGIKELGQRLVAEFVGTAQPNQNGSNQEGKPMSTESKPVETVTKADLEAFAQKIAASNAEVVNSFNSKVKEVAEELKIAYSAPKAKAEEAVGQGAVGAVSDKPTIVVNDEHLNMGAIPEYFSDLKLASSKQSKIFGKE